VTHGGTIAKASLGKRLAKSSAYEAIGSCYQKTYRAHCITSLYPTVDYDDRALRFIIEACQYLAQ
jgi:hypothetical protein